MKFLTDQDVYATTISFIRNLGHDVITAANLDLSTAEDVILLMKAQELNRIFITRDRDFGGLVFIKNLGKGVIYLRMLPSTQNSVHNELKRIISIYSEDKLMNAFIVVEPERHRFRKLKN